MIIDIYRFRRMILNDAVFRIPKQTFQKTHFAPIRTPVFQTDGNVFPTKSIRSDDEDCERFEWDDEGAVVAVRLRRLITGILDLRQTIFFGNVKRHVKRFLSARVVIRRP